MPDDFVINLFVVGAQKAGTTALAHFLDLHPEICMYPRKELHFFDFEQPVRDWSRPEVDRRVKPLFPNYAGQPIVGEATPVYMYLSQVPKRLRDYNPAARIIVLLRNPVERAVSHYALSRSKAVEWLRSGPAMRVESFRLWRDRNNFSERSSLRRHSYVDRGRYARQIRNLLDHFPREQVLFVRSDCLLRDHAGTIREVHRFLGLAAGALPDPERLFVGPADVGVSLSTYRMLASAFEDEIGEVESLLGWNLDAWRSRIRELSEQGAR
jgi:hypothetical protein